MALLVTPFVYSKSPLSSPYPRSPQSRRHGTKQGPPCIDACTYRACRDQVYYRNKRLQGEPEEAAGHCSPSLYSRLVLSFAVLLSTKTQIPGAEDCKCRLRILTRYSFLPCFPFILLKRPRLGKAVVHQPCVLLGYSAGYVPLRFPTCPTVRVFRCRIFEVSHETARPSVLSCSLPCDSCHTQMFSPCRLP